MDYSRFMTIDDLMKSLGHKSHALEPVANAKIVSASVIPAKLFHNHHELALGVLECE